MSGRLGDGLDLPFEAGDGGEFDASQALLSGGVVVMATVVDVPEMGKKPGLVFRFATPLGGFHPPILLITDDDQMANLEPLIAAAIATAREAVRS